MIPFFYLGQANTKKIAYYFVSSRGRPVKRAIVVFTGFASTDLNFGIFYSLVLIKRFK